MVGMTDNIKRKKHTGEPGNGGEFGSKRNSEANLALPNPRPRQARDEFNEISSSFWRSKQRYHAASIAAIREAGARVPGATTAVFDWGTDYGASGLVFSSLLDADGQYLDAFEYGVDDSLRDCAAIFTSYDDVTDCAGFEESEDSPDTFTVDLTDAPVEPVALHSIDHELKNLLADADLMDARIGEMAEAGIITVARAAFPSAGTIVLEGNQAEAPGRPYFEVTEIRSGGGRILWGAGARGTLKEFDPYLMHLNRVAGKVLTDEMNTWRITV